MTSIIWILFFAVVTLLMFVLVPLKKIAALLPFGLVGGCAVALVVQWSAVLIMNLWVFPKETLLLSFRGIPLGIILAWGSATIIFGAYFEYVQSFTTKLLYILGFAGISSLVEYGFVQSGYLYYINWNLFATFLLAAAIHSVLSVYLTLIYYSKISQDT